MEYTNKEYIVIKQKSLAIAISFITKTEHYQIHDDLKDPSKDVYVFKNTPRFQEAMAEVNKLLKQFKQENE